MVWIGSKWVMLMLGVFLESVSPSLLPVNKIDSLFPWISFVIDLMNREAHSRQHLPLSDFLVFLLFRILSCLAASIPPTMTQNVKFVNDDHIRVFFFFLRKSFPGLHVRTVLHIFYSEKKYFGIMWYFLVFIFLRKLEKTNAVHLPMWARLTFSQKGFSSQLDSNSLNNGAI